MRPPQQVPARPVRLWRPSTCTHPATSRQGCRDSRACRQQSGLSHAQLLSVLLSVTSTPRESARPSAVHPQGPKTTMMPTICRTVPVLILFECTIRRVRSVPARRPPNAIDFLCPPCLAEESPGGTASHIVCFSRVGGAVSTRPTAVGLAQGPEPGRRAAMPRPSPEEVNSIGGLGSLEPGCRGFLPCGLPPAPDYPPKLTCCSLRMGYRVVALLTRALCLCSRLRHRPHTILTLWSFPEGDDRWSLQRT